MRTKEKYLNHQFASLSADYESTKRGLEELEAKSAATNERVTKLTNETAELGERLEVSPRYVTVNSLHFIHC
jgi:predicted nuclease with TOPRIM domain